MNPEIEQAAADWIARRYAGFSPADTAEFKRWLAADPRHAAVFGEMDEAWRALDRVRESAASTADPDPDALAPRRSRPAVQRFAPLLAAAAAVAIGVYAGWPWSTPETGGSGWRTARQVEPFAETVTTAIGMVQKLTLPDGSVVRLNTDSLVEIAYSAVERRVSLVRGEAHFTVAKNPVRPFFVEVKGVAVRAVGTAFNVRLHAEAVEVLVTEGTVRVDDVARDESLIAPHTVAPNATEVPLLTAGERAVISLGPVPGEKLRPAPVAEVLPAEIERALAWQERRLEFVAAPLAEIVAEFNRHNRAKLSVVDPVLAGRRFGGNFRADEPETFVRLLETRFGLRSERRENVTELRSSP